jgi:hypothetical protein
MKASTSCSLKDTNLFFEERSFEAIYSLFLFVLLIGDVKATWAAFWLQLCSLFLITNSTFFLITN